MINESNDVKQTNDCDLVVDVGSVAFAVGGRETKRGREVDSSRRRYTLKTDMSTLWIKIDARTLSTKVGLLSR
jgi:hypothetical protein